MKKQTKKNNNRQKKIDRERERKKHFYFILKKIQKLSTILLYKKEMSREGEGIGKIKETLNNY